MISQYKCLSFLSESDPLTEENSGLSLTSFLLHVLKGIEPPLGREGTRPRTHIFWSKSSSSMHFRDFSMIQVNRARRMLIKVAPGVTFKSSNTIDNVLAKRLP